VGKDTENEHLTCPIKGSKREFHCKIASAVAARLRQTS